MSDKQQEKRRRNFFFKLRPILRWIIKLRSSSAAIAGGLGVGAFLAFSPTYGFQIFLALVLATMLNCNRAATLVPVWITNPVTLVPIYTFNYWVGTFFCDGPPINLVSSRLVEITKELARLDFLELSKQVSLFMHLGREVIIPLFIGSIVVGLIAGIAVYILSLKFLLWLNNRRKRKKMKKSLKNSKPH